MLCTLTRDRTTSQGNLIEYAKTSASEGAINWQLGLMDGLREAKQL